MPNSDKIYLLSILASAMQKQDMWDYSKIQPLQKEKWYSQFANNKCKTKDPKGKRGRG